MSKVLLVELPIVLFSTELPATHVEEYEQAQIFPGVGLQVLSACVETLAQLVPSELL